MPNLSSILNDPNYVNANAETKQAIFDRWAPEDPNYANANDATKQAIRQRFGLVVTPAAPVTPSTPVTPPGQIPGAAPGMVAPPAVSEVPFGRRAVQFVRPAVEAAGSIGGVMLGAPLGPPGAVAGAGLGYGAAKTGLDILEQSLGYQQPPSSAEEALTRGAKDVLMGSMFEAGGRAAAPAIGKVVGKVMDLRQIPQQRAATIAKQALGDDLPNVLATLRAAPPNASVSQITASIENPTWQALVQRSLERDPQFLRKLNLLSERESRNALAQLAGGDTEAAMRASLESSKRALNALTGPQREAALNRANLGKAVAEYEAQAGKLSADAAAKVQEVRRLIDLGDVAAAAARLREIKAGIPAGSTGAPARTQAGFSDQWAATFTYPGKLAQMSDEWASQAANASLDLGQGARFAQGAADALRSVGIKPLESAPLVRSLAGVSRNPEFAGNDLVLGALKNVADDITKWTNSGGVIDARALDAIRKNSVNAAIQQLRPGADATTQRNLASSVLTKVRPAIDDAIEAAGGTGYREYLARYAEGMRKINEKKLLGEAAKLWRSGDAGKDAFVNLVLNNDVKTVERVLGPGQYNIATELAQDTMDVLRAQAQKRIAQAAAKEQASEGQVALKELFQQNVSVFRLPSHLQAWVTNTNKALQTLEEAIGKKTMATLTQAMKTPQSAADLLSTLPGAERARVMELLQRPLVKGATEAAKKFAPAGALATTNALAPESSNALID